MLRGGITSYGINGTRNLISQIKTIRNYSLHQQTEPHRITSGDRKEQTSLNYICSRYAVHSMVESQGKAW